MQEVFLESEQLLKFNLDCIEDNKTRLKQVKNLEELINFKIKPIATSETVEHSKPSLLRDVDAFLVNQSTSSRQP